MKRGVLAGFRMRKSINFGGGFKINLSESGVGYSWGVPGFQITQTAKGTTRRTYSIPRTGMSYFEESFKNRNIAKAYQAPQLRVDNKPHESVRNIESAEIESFKTA